MIRQLNVALTWLASIGFAGVFLKFGAQGTFGQDSHAYWLALQGGELYRAGPTQLDAYLYSPLFAQLLTPLGHLPWPLFQGIWLGAGIAATLWLVRPLPLRWAVPVALTASTDLIIGNIYIFLAVMVALAVRTPYTWIFGILTKITPGVGLIWLLARREYRSVLRVTVVAAVLVGISWAMAPGDWADWIELLTTSRSGDRTLVPRCVLAVGIVVWAARRHPAWLAVAVTISTPVFNAAACIVPLLAIPRLVEARRQGRLAHWDVETAPATSAGAR
jgi:hypothetical protein